MSQYKKAVDAFLSGKIKGKFGKYLINGDALAYRTVIEKSLRKDYPPSNYYFNALVEGKAKKIRESIYYVDIIYLSENVIARRINGNVVGNSSILPLIGRRLAWGREKLNNKVTPIQDELSKRVPMIPFSVFSQANLNLDNLKILERGKEEHIEVKVTKLIKNDYKTVVEKRHFTGASLFEVDGKRFLFDIDRVEIKNKIFNSFLVELPNELASTINEAYESLKPDLVKRAESKNKKVKRQGEWFFIPVDKSFIIPPNIKVFGTKTDPTLPYYKRETLKLQAGERNRPNHAQTGFVHNGMAYVKGKIEHSGREHADLILKGWHIAVPNTAFDKSFTITGDID